MRKKFKGVDLTNRCAFISKKGMVFQKTARIIFAIFIALTFFASSAFGISIDNIRSKKPRIMSDRVEADNKLRSVRFLGNVVAVYKDIVLHSDVAVVKYKASKKKAAEPEKKEGDIFDAMPTSGGDKLESIIASGRVVFLQKDRRALCRQAVFNEALQTITMTGNPKLWQGEDYLSGDKVVLYLKSDKVKVFSSRGSRVTVQFVPKSEQPTLDADAEKRLEELMKEPTVPEADPSDGGNH